MYEYDQFYNIKSTFIFETKIWKHIFLYYFMGSFMKTHSTFLKKKKKKDPLEQAKLQRQNKFSFFRKKGFWKDAMIFEEKKRFEEKRKSIF